MKPRRRTRSTRPPPTSVVARACRSPDAEAREANTPISGGHERIPPQWEWHYRTLAHLRTRLLRAHAGPAAPAVEPAEMLGGDVVVAAQEQADRDVLWVQLGNESDQLFEVDCALQRIHEGTYGFCEKTGHAIPPERLRAVPWARYAPAAAEPMAPPTGDTKEHPP